MDASAAALQQRWDYGESVGALGASVRRYVVEDDGAPVFLAQALKRRFGVPVTLISRGPVWHPGASCIQRRAALEVLRRDIKGMLLITPEATGDAQTTRDARFRQVMTPSTAALLSLNGDHETRMHGKWRNRLRAAERAGLDVKQTSGRVKRMKWLLDADLAQQRAKGFRAMPTAFTEAWARLGHTGSAVFTAYRNGQRLAAMLFLRHGTTATYHVGWTSDAGRAVSAHALILKRAADQLSATGVRQLDLGLVDTVNAPGLARFKLGSGATPRQTGGTWLGW